ncbi:MAG: hypothetical protein ACRDOK_10125 [Streptosporangiaceae bacterium]
MAAVAWLAGAVKTAADAAGMHGRWASAPCPVGSEEVSRRKVRRQHKSRMDARTRERLPVLPALAAAVTRHRRDTEAVLDAARHAEPGHALTAAGQA